MQKVSSERTKRALVLGMAVIPWQMCGCKINIDGTGLGELTHPMIFVGAPADGGTLGAVAPDGAVGAPSGSDPAVSASAETTTGADPSSCEAEPGPFGDPHAGTIACAGSEEGTCQLPQICCLSGAPKCTAASDCPHVADANGPTTLPEAFACDGKEDCPAGQLCLMHAGRASFCSRNVASTSVLPAGGYGVCHGAGDCSGCRPLNSGDARGSASQIGVCGCDQEMTAGTNGTSTGAAANNAAPHDGGQAGVSGH